VVADADNLYPRLHLVHFPVLNHHFLAHPLVHNHHARYLDHKDRKDHLAVLDYLGLWDHLDVLEHLAFKALQDHVVLKAHLVPQECQLHPRPHALQFVSIGKPSFDKHHNLRLNVPPNVKLNPDVAHHHSLAASKGNQHANHHSPYASHLPLVVKVLKAHVPRQALDVLSNHALTLIHK